MDYTRSCENLNICFLTQTVYSSDAACHFRRMRGKIQIFTSAKKAIQVSKYETHILLLITAAPETQYEGLLSFDLKQKLHAV